MSRLSDDLQASLRSGDLFAPYSGCQYLLMVLDASSETRPSSPSASTRGLCRALRPMRGCCCGMTFTPWGNFPCSRRGEKAMFLRGEGLPLKIFSKKVSKKSFCDQVVTGDRYTEYVRYISRPKWTINTHSKRRKNA